MKWITLTSLLFIAYNSEAQHIRGLVLDENKLGIPGVKVRNCRSNSLSLSDVEGRFSIKAIKGDVLILSANGFDSLHFELEDFTNDTEISIELRTNVQDLGETRVTGKRLAEFDVGFLPAIKDVQIYTGTNAVIQLENLSGAKSSGNAREMFAKIPGLNVWESDGAGIQIGIGGRGLSPNRTANFNTRQNGYDISADALGYPESYYTPPFEALQSIEIIRGSASLQYGTQFGGLLNFIIKEPNLSSKLEWTTRNTVGSYGYLASFNRITGTFGRTSYQVYHQYKRGNGYRENSEFGQHQVFAQFSQQFTERIRLRLEYTHMNYLTKQAGGLSDLAFETDPRQSFRDRNWFKVDWNLLALHFDQEIGKDARFNIRAFGMSSTRQTLGYLGKITTADPGGAREMLNGDFKNAGSEVRFLDRYSIDGKKIRGAYLIGVRYYRGETNAQQGLATDGDNPDFRYRNPSELEGSSFDYPSENLAAFAENIVFIGNKVTLNFGLRMEHIFSASAGYYKQYIIHPINYDTLGIYTLRDSNEVLRNVPLFGFGGSFKVSKQASLYTNFTQNYRAINFTDIRISNPNIIIDSAIRDEYGYTGELGFRGLVNTWMIFDLAAFYVFYGDKIGLAPKPGTILKERTNIGDARNMGLELFTEVDFLKITKHDNERGLSLFLNAAYINAVYIRSKESNYVNKQVEYVSPVIVKSGLRFKTKALTLQVQGSYNSSQYADATNAVEPSGDAVIGLVPSYYVLDFSGRYHLNRSISFELGVNNFTNEQYFTRRAPGYPGPGILPSDGISFYGTFQYQFRTK